MKKLLLFALATVLILNICPVYALEGTVGEIVIKQFDFEGGLDGFASHKGGKVGLGTEDGNKFMTLTHADSAAAIINYHTTGTLGSDYATMGFTKDLSVPLDKNKRYFFRFNARWKSGSEGEFYEIITTHGGQDWPKINSIGASKKEGWTEFQSLNLISSRITNSTLTNIYLKSNLANELGNAMQATKSYHGKGLGSKGKQWSVEVDGKTYNFSEDCSVFGNEQEKAAALSAYLEENPIYYEIDDLKLYTEAMFYEDTVTVLGDEPEITALVNPETGETHPVTDGSVIKTNDYFGTIYEIDGVVLYVKLDGEEISTKYEKGKTIFTISPQAVNKNHHIEIAPDIITEDVPFITNLKISGDKNPGSVLTATYDYSCKYEDASEFKWQRLDGEEWVDIPGATSKDYVVKTDDSEKYIRVCVTAKNNAGKVWRILTATIFAGEAGFFVATDGDDENPGSKDKPFRTIEKAMDKIAELKAMDALPEGELAINIRGGDYRLSKALEFDRENSGTGDTKIIYKAYNGEKVRFMGSKKISSDRISKVTSEDTDSFGRRVLDCVIDEQAKSNLYKIDLSEYEGELPPSQSAGRAYNSEGRDPQNKTSFKPVVVYVNNEPLVDARWPNRELDSAMILSERVSGSITNGGTVGYPDDEGRTKLWNREAVEADGRVELHTSYHWCSNRYDITSFDSQQKLFSVNGSGGVSNGYALYFVNILEETDMPGESFIDRDAKVVYFYPSTDLTDAEVEVSVLEDNMIRINGAENLSFEGLDFVFTRQTPFMAKNVKGLTLRDCVIAHSSYGLADVRGTGITIDSCHIYDSKYSGLTIGGGDRENAVPSGNIIKNSIFHQSAQLQTSYCSSIQLIDVFGCTITGNLLYDNPHMLLGLGTGGQVADVLIENNEFHSAVTEHGDMGAIYWGRNPAMIGVTIRNNYFHHIGNVYNNGWSQSIFVDDGAYGADIYSNIFYQGTLTEARGGTVGMSFPVKTNGGQFMNVHNNIFVDAPNATQFSNWGDKFTREAYGVQYSKSGSSVTWSGKSWAGTCGPYCDNPAWESYFKGTMWERFFDFFSNERYEALQELKGANDTAGVDAYIKPWKAVAENIFDNNVCVEVSTPKGMAPSASTVLGTNYVHTDKSVDKKYLFEDYGTDFALSSEGLAEVRAVLPDFENIDTSVIGSFDPVDGHAPVIKAPSYGGRAAVGEVLKASYEFYDADGDKEGHSHFEWLESDTKDGEFKPIKGKGARDILLSDEQNGKYVKYRVTVLDINNRYGSTVESEPVLVSANPPSFEVTDFVSGDEISFDVTIPVYEGYVLAALYAADGRLEEVYVLKSSPKNSFTFRENGSKIKVFHLTDGLVPFNPPICIE